MTYSKQLLQGTDQGFGFRHLAYLAIACTLAQSLPAAEPKEPAPDTEKIQGLWEIVTFTEGGVDRRDSDQVWQMKFDGDSLAFVVDGKETIGCRFKLKSESDPKQIDWIIEIDPGKPIIQKGIYKLDGDSFEMNVAPADRARPTTLEGKQGESTNAMVLKRSKKQK